MKAFFLIVLLVVIAAGAGGVYYLGTWDVPVEQETVVKPLPASNFGAN